MSDTPISQNIDFSSWMPQEFILQICTYSFEMSRISNRGTVHAFPLFVSTETRSTIAQSALSLQGCELHLNWIESVDSCCTGVLISP